MDNLALIRTAYASPLREKLLHAVTSDPYDGGFDYDYVYDTQDDRPVATTVGPGRITPAGASSFPWICATPTSGRSNSPGFS
jgi:hypothetical protein